MFANAPYQLISLQVIVPGSGRGKEGKGREMMGEEASSSLDGDDHVFYFSMLFESLPSYYEEEEINRLTLAYFVISGLDILGALDLVDKENIINWVLSLQVFPTSEGHFSGFLGSSMSRFPQDNSLGISSIASTYSALCILKIVGYDLSELNSEAIVSTLKYLQHPDGSFTPIHTGAEKDLRFIYCAAAICHMLDDWSGIDINKAMEYIISCQSYDGGFGLIPGMESHGGGTYCAVASLKLMGTIPDDPLFRETLNSLPCNLNLPLLLEWCLQRQGTDGGFQGRTNKVSDSCYAFWIGGVLRILGASRFIHSDALKQFLLTCQSKYGGFSKYPRKFPDLYHSYFGLSAFSLLEEPGLHTLCVELGITKPATK